MILIAGYINNFLVMAVFHNPFIKFRFWMIFTAKINITEIPMSIPQSTGRKTTEVLEIARIEHVYKIRERRAVSKKKTRAVVSSRRENQRYVP